MKIIMKFTLFVLCVVAAQATIIVPSILLNGGSEDALPVLITVQPVSDTVTEGGTASFSITATGVISYIVYRNSDSVDNDNSYSFTTVLADDGDSIWWKCTNADGSVYSDTVFLQVNEIAPTITVQPMNDTVESGSNCYFTVTATGTNLRYKGYVNSDSVGATSSISYATTILNDGDSIRFMVFNSSDTLYSDTVNLRVVVTPVITGININKINVVGTFTNAADKTATIRGSSATVTAQTGSTMAITLPISVTSGSIDTLKIDDDLDSCWYQIKYTKRNTKLTLLLKQIISSGITVDSIGIVQFTALGTFPTVDSAYVNLAKATINGANGDSLLLTAASPLMWRSASYPLTLYSSGTAYGFNYWLRKNSGVSSIFATSVQTGTGF